MSERFNQILDIVSANSDESLDDFIDLMKPQEHTREEMGAILEDTIGYDATSYYDKHQLKVIAESIAGDPETPEVVSNYLTDSLDDAVDAAYEIFEEVRDGSVLPAAMEEAIQNETGVNIDIEVEEDEDDDDVDEDYDEE